MEFGFKKVALQMKSGKRQIIKGIELRQKKNKKKTNNWNLCKKRKITITREY